MGNFHDDNELDDYIPPLESDEDWGDDEVNEYLRRRKNENVMKVLSVPPEEISNQGSFASALWTIEQKLKLRPMKRNSWNDEGYYFMLRLNDEVGYCWYWEGGERNYCSMWGAGCLHDY